MQQTSTNEKWNYKSNLKNEQMIQTSIMLYKLYEKALKIIIF